MPAGELARVRAKPPIERRIAIVLLGSATPQTAATLLAAFCDAGYRVEDAPADGAALAVRLRGEPEETLSFATYSAVFATLPMPVQQQVSARWGAAERDPLFRPGRLDCGRFMIPAVRCGNVAVLAPPSAGEAAPVPPHSHLAAYAWLSDEFRADAVIDLEPPEGLTDAMLGPVPRLFVDAAGEEIDRRVLAAFDGEPR